MSERILKALMQLFAIVAKVDIIEGSDEIVAAESSKAIVRTFLKQELTSDLVEKYLKIFDEFVDERHGTKRKKDSQKKRRSLNSVKVLRICTQINTELEQRQKVIVLVEVLEFIFADANHTEKEIAFAETVSQTFNISTEEYNEIFQFVSETPNNLANHENHLSITSKESSKERKDKHILAKGIIGDIYI